MQKINLTAIIPEELANKRLDQALAILFPDYSRARLQSWIKAGQVLVDGTLLKAKEKVSADQEVIIAATIVSNENWRAQPIELNIAYEDDDILVINKPAGLVVHPGAGTPDSTLLNALLHHCPELNTIPRGGIIHRLDKDTSGLLVITKTLPAHTKLVADLQERKISREYEAVVNGVMTAGGTVDAPIARHPKDRVRMAVVLSGKPAITHYRVLEKFRTHTHVKVNLETGRTHQIRVHMAHIHYPIVGDPVYGGRLKLPKGCNEELRTTLQKFKRQALHARRLEFAHPISGEIMTFKAKLPTDMQQLITDLQEDTLNHRS